MGIPEDQIKAGIISRYGLTPTYAQNFLDDDSDPDDSVRAHSGDRRLPRRQAVSAHQQYLAGCDHQYSADHHDHGCQHLVQFSILRVILTDTSVKNSLKCLSDRRLSVGMCLFSCLTELFGRKSVKSIWRPKHSKECRSPSFFS